MKTYKDIYEFPLVKSKHNSWVYDKSMYNFVFQFEPRWTNGDYAEGYLELEQKLLKVINNEENLTSKEIAYIHEKGEIFGSNDKETPIITIRGWGGLTGVGKHHLPGDEAANIQDTFAEYIVERLNYRE